MTQINTDRDRLTHAFEDLRRHGIEARAALPVSVPEGHARLRAELARRFPAGLGSYVFWTRSDEDGFDAAGALTGPVTLHCSTADVAAALAAACRRAGIAVQPYGRATVLRVAPPHEVTAAPAPAAQRRVARSPWRWLGPGTPARAR